MDPRLFHNVRLRVERIIRYNYMESFFTEKKIELLSIPVASHKLDMPKLEFNSIGPDANPLPG